MARAGLTTGILVQAGADLADTIGFSAVTLTELARRFDVKVASLYSHVKNSEDLRQKISLLALGRLADGCDEAIAGRAGKAALVALANAVRDFALKHPGLFEACRQPPAGPFDEAHGGVRMSNSMRAMLRGYALTDDNCTHARRLLGSFFLGFTMLERSGAFSYSVPDSDESWTRTLDFLDMTFRNWQ